MTPASKQMDPQTKRIEDGQARLGDEEFWKRIETSGFWEDVERRGYLAELVKKNGPRGSAVVKAFALFEDYFEKTQLETAFEIAAMAKLTDNARFEWSRLAPAVRRHILGGWHDAGEGPRSREFLRYLERITVHSVEWVLTAKPHCDGTVDCFADFEFFETIAPLEVRMRRGIDQATALRALRDVKNALKVKWPEVISLDGKTGLTVQTATPRGVARSAETRPSDGLPLGTYVTDGPDQAGFIVAGAKGTNGWCYLFIQADGQINTQFEGGLKTVPGKRRGLPAVVDISGRDPLAELRGAQVEPLVVDMKGRPIGTQKKPRTGLKTTRVLGGGEGKSRAEAAAQ